jgi:hypothetical protein
MSALTRDMDVAGNNAKQPVRIFNTEKVINANTTEMVGRGKLEFNVTHHFQDVAGSNGGIKNFFGLDKSSDIRIGFQIGLSDRVNLTLAHIKGDEIRLRPDVLHIPATVELLPDKLYEIGLKILLLRQLEKDPSHPVSLALFVNSVVSTVRAVPGNNPRGFDNFGERTSQVYQLILAKKIGKVSVQLNPTVVHHNFVPSYDDPTTFALGAAARIPFTQRFALLLDYFHCFISDEKKANYYNTRLVKFKQPAGIGFELTTGGHVFSLKFTNNTAIMENQFIPYNSNSWCRGQYRWAFNISRMFSLWRPKSSR